MWKNGLNGGCGVGNGLYEFDGRYLLCDIEMDSDSKEKTSSSGFYDFY